MGCNQLNRVGHLGQLLSVDAHCPKGTVNIVDSSQELSAYMRDVSRNTMCQESHTFEPEVCIWALRSNLNAYICIFILFYIGQSCLKPVY